MRRCPPPSHRGVRGAARCRWTPARAALPSFRDRTTDVRRRHTPCPPYNPANRHGGRATVNPTARWPERLEHLATLLRADALAVISATPDGPTTVFSYRLHAPPD